MFPPSGQAVSVCVYLFIHRNNNTGTCMVIYLNWKRFDLNDWIDKLSGTLFGSQFQWILPAFCWYCAGFDSEHTWDTHSLLKWIGLYLIFGIALTIFFFFSSVLICFFFFLCCSVWPTVRTVECKSKNKCFRSIGHIRSTLWVRFGIWIIRSKRHEMRFKTWMGKRSSILW